MSKAKAKPAAKRAARKTGGAAGTSDTIRVRMYRIGFGDCFLMSLGRGAKTAHILIDCGVHPQGDIKTLGQIVANIRSETVDRLDLVVASHAHKDHISAFASQADQFAKMSVGEVWLPWTENTSDRLAAKYRQKQAKLAGMVGAHLAATRRMTGAAAHSIANLTGNEKAMQSLRGGIKGGKVSYLESGMKVDDVAGISGLKAVILGPPRDEKFLAKKDPPGNERFLRLGAGGKAEAVDALVPFAKQWRDDRDAYPRGLVSKADRQYIIEQLADPEALAFKLDQAMNNTSLVIVFSYKGKNLLFPGDAQYGNWQYWLDRPEAGEILQNLDFYKVGHHGSFNATPKSALEKMSQGRFAAMVSTQSKPWETIPLGKLMTALQKKSRGVARSDSISVPGAIKGPAARAGAGFSKGSVWFDYTIKV